jgi:hypothetical protein
VNGCLPQQIKYYPHHFLEWFVGFTEGDGSFIISHGRLFFTITQKDLAFLRRLRTELGFGTVCKDNRYPEIGRLVVTHRDQILILIHLFNGNLLLKRSAKRFALWVEEYNRLTGAELPILKPPTPHFQRGGNLQTSSIWNSSWFAGFTDAEGCFSGSFNTFKKKIVLKFILDQTDELELFLHIREILGRGSLFPRKETEKGVHWRYEVESLEVLQRLADYFTRRRLRTKKNISFVRWKKLLNLLIMIQKEGKGIGSEKRGARIRRLLSEINNGNSVRTSDRGGTPSTSSRTNLFIEVSDREEVKGESVESPPNGGKGKKKEKR